MRQKSGTRESSSERLVKNIRRVTRKQSSSEEKIRIVLDGLRGECSIAELGDVRALLKLSGSLVHDYATISDDSPSPNRASRARRAATSAGIS